MEKTATVYERLFQAATEPFCDDVTSVDRINYLKKELITYIVEDIMFQLYRVVERNCAGCHTNHPSQLQHSCLMTTQDEWIDVYFEDVLDQIDFDNVLEQWYPILNRMHLRQNEAERAYIMWTNIKEEFDMMSRHSEPFWVAEWQERLRQRFNI
jgi:hypothetical protein